MFKPNKIKNIGFILTRLQGTDGVTLETTKWVKVLESLGYHCYFFTGLSDWDAEKTMVIPEAFFDHPRIKDIQSQCFGTFTRSSELTGKIHAMRVKLKEKLYLFLHRFKPDLIIPENSLTIPMNIPLGLALTEFIAETSIPTIAHHHDFYWERQRFNVNCVPDFLAMAFPPTLPSIKHVVINSQADRELSFRTGLSPDIIPNVIDFSTSAPPVDDFNKDVRKDLGLAEDDIFILQPTRIVARKGIEHSIEILNRLENPKAKLVITHQAGDEGFSYEERIRRYAKIMKVPLIIRPDIIGKEREITPLKKKKYTLWDIYPHADLVTYPSIYEGFGNAFLEAIYFKKPILVNHYSIYEVDIEPRGFNAITMHGFITDDVIDKIKLILNSEKEREKMVEANYLLASKYFSLDVLTYKLKTLLIHFEGLNSN